MTTRLPSTGIVVLGMHRSGTSATARLFGELGCDFGGALLDGREDNPDGFFEHQGVVATHNEFLSRCGRSWDDPRRWRPEDFETEAAHRARGELAEIFAADFAGRSPWVLKDPRLCRLLPLWHDILSEVDARFAIVFRHPVAVARSLERRDEMSRSQAMWLWLRHVLEAERQTRGRPRCHLGFEDLMANPRSVQARLLHELGLDEDLQPSARAADRSLQPSKVHHRVGETEDRQLADSYPWAWRCHRVLCGLRSDDDSAELDAIADEMLRAEQPFYDALVLPLEAMLADRDADRENLRQILAARDESMRRGQEYARELRAVIAAKDAYTGRLLEHIARLQREPNQD